MMSQTRKEFIILTRDKGSNKIPWEERIAIPIDANPKEYFENLIKKFNDDEDEYARKGIAGHPRYREFLGFKGETGIETTYCNLSGKKINNVTIIKNNLSYDVMRCPECGMCYQRTGLGQNFDYDNRICKPNQVCKECNKLFASEKLLKNHMEKGKHKTPKWLMETKRVA